MKKVLSIYIIMLTFILFTSCTEQKQREYDIIDGKIYIDLFENKEEFIKNDLKKYNGRTYNIYVSTGAHVEIYVDYSKMDDYMKAVHRCNLKYSYSNEEDKIKDYYYYYLNSYIYDSFNYDFNIYQSSVDKKYGAYHNCKDKPIIYLGYGEAILLDHALSITGIDYFYKDYKKIKEISSYDYVIKIEVIEFCVLFDRSA